MFGRRLIMIIKQQQHFARIYIDSSKFFILLRMYFLVETTKNCEFELSLNEYK